MRCILDSPWIYTYNDVNDPNRYYYRSDHYNFAKNGIPVIFIFFWSACRLTIVQTDTVEKIIYERIVKISQMVFYTAWELVNRKETIRRDVPQTP